MNKKMADVNIGPFEEHESRPEEPTNENIPLTPIRGGSTWEPTREQETSFGEKSFETLKGHLRSKKKLSSNERA